MEADGIVGAIVSASNTASRSTRPESAGVCVTLDRDPRGHVRYTAVLEVYPGQAGPRYAGATLRGALMHLWMAVHNACTPR